MRKLTVWDQRAFTPTQNQLQSGSGAEPGKIEKKYFFLFILFFFFSVCGYEH